LKKASFRPEGAGFHRFNTNSTRGDFRGKGKSLETV
jgi:hypothetical protein